MRDALTRVTRRQVDHEARVRALAQERGAKLTRQGAIWRVRGPTIDILTADLAWIRADDFGSFAASRRADA